ncbi:MAG TPA: redoxin domain-containing protein [Pirellulales bacterium]|jgi:peroxiredoxin/tetratricopeptide (TPR) repeat protein|nr:redoxin domain-containing protein [Pirellulales bacterium]
MRVAEGSGLNDAKNRESTRMNHQSIKIAVLIFLTLNLTPIRAADSGGPATAAPAAPNVAAAQPGHSLHGEVFDEGPRQKAYLMLGMPKVDFPVSTKQSEAQAFFNQGVGQLHGFWYFEAERSFRQVAAIDPDCVMAYWGMAMANVNNEKRAKDFIGKAAARKAEATPRERAWIEALAAYYAAPDNADRRRQYVRALEAIVHDDPKDVEAKAFLALQIWVNGDWMTEKSKRVPISSYQAVDALLDQVFAAEPMHPAHHYRIHLWDEEKPKRALASAALCGQTSPGIAHMWHMPGHIYSDLHRYADAAWQQEASARVDHAYMIRDDVLPDQIFNYAHNNEWLIRDLAAIGRVHDAIDLAKNMLDLPRHPKYNMIDGSEGSAHLGRERLVSTLVEYERWGDLVALSSTSYLPPRDTPDDKIQRARLLGRAQAELGHADEARAQLTALDAMLSDERAARYKSADEAEVKARADRKSEDEIARRMAEALKSHGPRIRSLERAVGELKGRLALAAGDHTAAKAEFDKLDKGDELRRDHLAQIYLRLGDNSRAEELARKAFDRNPGEVYPLANLVAVLAAVGKQTEATAQFEKLRTLAGSADLDQPVFDRLAPLAKELKLPEDWRTPKIPTDVGERPDLTTLGPFRWAPRPAPNWSLPEPDGHLISLEQYRGKPVLVLFYLGSGCLHCVEQLKKFSPLAGEFSTAGIPIVAISSEPLDSLKQSLATLKKDETINLPLVSDGDRAVFRAYRAYDDFENMPLHGAFLIDGAGLVRWHDIGYEPFMDAKFVLDEAKRLLPR